MKNKHAAPLKIMEEMMRFVAELNDSQFINISADRMEISGDFLLAWAGENLVAMVDTSALLMAKLENNQVWKGQQ